MVGISRVYTFRQRIESGFLPLNQWKDQLWAPLGDVNERLRLDAYRFEGVFSTQSRTCIVCFLNKWLLDTGRPTPRLTRGFGRYSKYMNSLYNGLFWNWTKVENSIRTEGVFKTIPKFKFVSMDLSTQLIVRCAAMAY